MEALAEELRTLSERVISMETQVRRIVSDIESEKGTRERQDTRLESQLTILGNSIENKLERNAETRDQKFAQMDGRLSKIEKIILIVTGAGLVIQQILPKLWSAIGAVIHQ